MALQANLVKRDGTYYCRVYVPMELQAKIGKKEVWRSLKTGSYREATYYAKRQTSEILHELGIMTHKPELTNEIIEQIGEKYFYLMLTQDEGLRAHNRKFTAKMPPEQAEDYKESKEKHESETHQKYLDALTEGNWEIMQTQAKDQLGLFDIELNAETPSHQHSFETLCMTLLHAKVQSINEIINRNQGNWGKGIGKTKIKSLSQAIAHRLDPSNQYRGHGNTEHPHNAPNLPRVTLKEAIDKYNSVPENQQKSDDTKQKKAAHQRVMLEILGAHSSVFEYDIDTSRTLLDALRYLPTNITKKFPNLSAKEIIQRTKADNSIPRLAPNTANRYMNDFRGLVEFTYREYKIPFHDITKGIRLNEEEKAKNRRNPLSHEKLKLLFSYRGVIKARNHRRQEYKFWMPFLALCTGTRLSEILFIRKEEIIKRNDFWFFQIIYRSDRRLKKSASVREIPIHSTLIEHGFFDYLDEMKATHGETGYLFEDAMNPQDPADAYSKVFARQQIKTGIQGEPRKDCFHSLRHSYRDAMREAELSHDAIGALGGWADNSVSGSYGSSLSDRQLNEAMQKLDFSFLDEVLND